MIMLFNDNYDRSSVESPITISFHGELSTLPAVTVTGSTARQSFVQKLRTRRPHGDCLDELTPTQNSTWTSLCLPCNPVMMHGYPITFAKEVV